MSQLFAKKSVQQLLKESENSGEDSLKRTLSSLALISLGIGVVIGAGIFVRTAAAAAQNAGPSVTLGFVVAGIGCALAGLCYAELSSSIPISGSAYTYTYATMGEFLAWIIGWDLVLEYAVGAATVGIAWSEYLNDFLTQILGVAPIPYQWCHSPFQVSVDGVQGIVNLPALGIVTAVSFLLIKGIQESAFVNNIIVIVKVAIVLLIITLGWSYINPANHTPYIPEPTKYTDHDGITYNFGGIMGILGAAGTVFFAYIGFDAITTAAQETKNPKKAMPVGIIGTLIICTILYILFSYVLTGLESVEFFRDPNKGGEASVSAAIQSAMPAYTWLSKSITIAILAGFSSVILVLLLGQSRVFYSMSRDGLLPKAFSEIHPKYKTPYKGTLAVLVLVALFAGFVPGNVVGHMTSIGTLFAFILVCVAVIVLRKVEPDMPRQFKTPFVPVVPILGILFCGAMIFGLGVENWMRLIVWLLIGFVIYFGYSKKHSKLNNSNNK
ncbi:MAG TPA: amino acid permease [Chitinophagales bacterium]|nr:amino acid permease [Chitinophagales bacterium]HMU98824.1 amino acid permease [Chitinophagales bacterium]HMV03421.1 amino acid permease [Chitinophagales bacterium]HMW95210.1 amino acid permease [Chitinophagales bacterium]HMY43298.1 amino acid permease [Chitinophagales bacterium]